MSELNFNADPEAGPVTLKVRVGVDAETLAQIVQCVCFDENAIVAVEPTLEGTAEREFELRPDTGGFYKIATQVTGYSDQTKIEYTFLQSSENQVITQFTLRHLDVDVGHHDTTINII